MIHVFGPHDEKLKSVYGKLIELGLNIAGDVYVYVGKCKSIEGLFILPHDCPTIYLCNNKRIIYNFIHELVHFEQWNDGKSLTEYGVEKRTKNFYRRLNEK